MKVRKKVPKSSEVDFHFATEKSIDENLSNFSKVFFRDPSHLSEDFEEEFLY